MEKGSLLTQVGAGATAWHCPKSDGKRREKQKQKTKKKRRGFIFFEIAGNISATHKITEINQN